MARISVSSLLADERVRFVIIGGFNTVFGYVLFAILQLTVGDVIGYLGSLYGSYVVAVVVAFFLHRGFTFRVRGTGNVFIDLLRFASVYVVSLVVNTIALPILVEIVGLDPLVAQALTVFVTTMISYFGHKFFSFRRTKEAIEPEEEPRAESA